MRIGILGAGLIDGPLTKLAAERGFPVMIGARRSDAPAGLAAEIERARPAYHIPLGLPGSRQALDVATREGELPHGSWR